MKKTITKLLGIAVGVMSYGAQAQCPTITSVYSTSTAATSATFVVAGSVTIAPVGSYHIYWSVTPGATSSYLYGGMGDAVSFPANTVYTVCATVIDSTGAGCPTSSACTTINVTGVTGCTANFTQYIDSFCVTHFVNTSSGPSISSSSWLVDGIVYASTPSLSLTAGSHYVKLYNFSGASVCDSIDRNITITCPIGGGGGTSTITAICNAAFAIHADSAGAPGTYTAWDMSSGPAGLSYFWDFGDGTTSTLATPSHTYSPAGSYIVCLTVSSGTCSSTYCDSSSVHRVSSAYLMNKIIVRRAGAPTGINELSEVIGLNAYPNPIGNELTVEIATKENKTVNYTLIDALGRIVLTGIIENQKATISTSQLEKGFYNLSISNDKNQLLKSVKLIK